MVKVNLGSMNGHISSVKAISGQRIASLQEVISSLDQFASAGSLQGQAYTNAKNFGQEVLRTLAQGLIVYSEQLSESASRLGSLYASLVGDESLDESVLRANIASYQASLAHQSSIYNRLMGEDILNFRSLNSLHNAMSITNNRLQKEQEKLDRLLTFNSQSASVFSDLSQLEKSITSGFSSVRSSFGQHAGRGGFSIPDKMTWKKDLDDRWKERVEVIQSGYDAVVKKVEKGEELIEEDIRIINRYVHESPHLTLAPSIQNAIQFYMRRNVTDIVSQDIISVATDAYYAGQISEELFNRLVRSSDEELQGFLHLLLSNFEDPVGNIIEGVYTEYRDGFVQDILLKVANSAPIVASHTSNNISKAGLIVAIGTMLSSAPDNLKNIAYNIIENTVGTSTGATTKIGTAISKLGAPTSGIVSKIGLDSYASVGLASLATGIDVWSQVGSGENVVNATAKGVAHTAMSTAVIGKTAAIGAAWGTAIPIPGGTIIGAFAGVIVGVAISYGAGEVFDDVYDSTLGKVIDWAMDNEVGRAINENATNFVKDTNKAIDKKIEDVKEKLGDVGEAVGSWFGAIGSAIS